jgi:hypothetical protein
MIFDDDFQPRMTRGDLFDNFADHVRQGRRSIVDDWRERGLHLDHFRNKQGHSLLVWAVASMDAPLVRNLLSLGADPRVLAQNHTLLSGMFVPLELSFVMAARYPDIREGMEVVELLWRASPPTLREMKSWQEWISKNTDTLSGALLVERFDMELNILPQRDHLDTTLSLAPQDSSPPRAPRL